MAVRYHPLVGSSGMQGTHSRAFRTDHAGGQGCRCPKIYCASSLWVPRVLRTIRELNLTVGCQEEFGIPRRERLSRFQEFLGEEGKGERPYGHEISCAISENCLDLQLSFGAGAKGTSAAQKTDRSAGRGLGRGGRACVVRPPAPFPARSHTWFPQPRVTFRGRHTGAWWHGDPDLQKPVSGHSKLMIIQPRGLYIKSLVIKQH